MDTNQSVAKIIYPEVMETKKFTDPLQAYDYLLKIYTHHVDFLQNAFQNYCQSTIEKQRFRAFYPFIRISTWLHRETEASFSYGFVSGLGHYQTTVTTPSLFKDYLLQQMELLLINHQMPLEIGQSEQPIPIHFVFPDGMHLEFELSREKSQNLRNVFDAPDLTYLDDSIVNGTHFQLADQPMPLALFTAPRVDFSLNRLKHYTGTSAHHFQHYILYTNYQFYIDEFIQLGRDLMAQSSTQPEYIAFVEPGNVITPHLSLPQAVKQGTAPDRLPQMPAYHLQRADGSGITMINIGVGPSNAKNMTDHVAVIRPHAWIMLGHCAGLRHSQRLGDYVLAHGYVREDHVLDADLPLWIPIPALAEVQLALERAVKEVTQLAGVELKKVLRTGTVATVDNRNWELREQDEPLQRLSQSRAIALDMESATIAANGFRFRVPYGTLLCVSDKPFHGELKLPGMANQFYRDQVSQHLKIGIQAMVLLRTNQIARLHSRKLRSLAEVAFR